MLTSILFKGLDFSFLHLGEQTKVLLVIEAVLLNQRLKATSIDLRLLLLLAASLH
jgi:uncharacterized membrane protein YqjE